MADWKNKLYFGDNLGILREQVADESVDPIYLDPPFNSNATYNVLFRDASGEGSRVRRRFGGRRVIGGRRGGRSGCCRG